MISFCFIIQKIIQAILYFNNARNSFIIFLNKHIVMNKFTVNKNKTRVLIIKLLFLNFTLVLIN